MVGKPLLSRFRLAPPGTCSGAFDLATPFQAGSIPAVRIIGWAWKAKQQSEVARIYVTDDGGASWVEADRMADPAGFYEECDADLVIARIEAPSSCGAGTIIDADALCAHAHAQGAVVSLDAYHSVGVVPVDVKASGVDFLTGGVLKWLCGGPVSSSQPRAHENPLEPV